MTSLVENRSSHEYNSAVDSLSFPKQRDICALNIHSNSQLKYKIHEDSLDKLDKENDADSGCVDGMTSPSKLEENSEVKSANSEEMIKSDQVPTDASQLLRNILQNKEKGTGENNNSKEMLTNNLQHGEPKRSDRHMIENLIPTYRNEEDGNSVNSGDVSCDGSDYGSSNEHLNNLDDVMDRNYDVDSPTENGSYSPEDSKEAKRARVENILSNMRPSSCGSPDHNGSNFQEGRRQKRKQYQPIQHDPYWPDHSNIKYRKLEKMALQEQQFKLKQQLHLVQKRIYELSDDEQEDENEKISATSYSVEKNILEVPRIKDYNNRLLQNPESSSKQLKVQCTSSGNPTDNGKSSPRHEKKNLSKSQPLQKLDLENLTNSLKCGLSDALNSVVDSILNRYLEERPAKANDKVQEKCKTEPEQISKETKPKEEVKPKEPEPVAPISRISSHRESFHHDLRHDHIGNMARILEKTSAFETPRGLTPELHRHPHHPLPFPLPFTYFPSQMMHPPAMYSCAPPTMPEPEQTEALPLVVNSSMGTPKKKRTKVTDTRLSPRAARALLGQEPIPLNPSSEMDRHHPTSFPTLIPPALPTSVAIPNPSLQESTLMSFYRDHTPFSDISSRNHSPMHGDHPSPSNNQSPSDSISQMMKFDSMESGSDSYDSHNMHMTSTLTPMHLRKAKLMFFYVRYPSSAILKVYFPDVKFNKNNTAQLVKWFSNFREFYYIQMEKYARQSIAEGCKHPDDLVVTTESELYRILNLHYNRNNQIDVPDNFRGVIQATLREFYRALIGNKDQEPSWKKSIYKVIARMDDSIPEYFKSPNWMEQLGDM